MSLVKINNVVFDQSKIDHITSSFTMNSIKNGLALREKVKPARPFHDAVIESQVLEVDKCSGAEKSALWAFLMKTTSESKPSMFDMNTLIPAKENVYILSTNSLKVRAVSEEDEEVREEAGVPIDQWCNREIHFCGGVQVEKKGVPDPLASVIRMAVSSMKIKKNEIKSSATTNNDPDQVPTVLVDVFKETFTSEDMSIAAMQNFYDEVKKNPSKHMASIKLVATQISTHAPSLGVYVLDSKTNKYTIKKERLVQYTEKRVRVAKLIARGCVVESPLMYVRPQISKKTSMISAKGAGKIARDVYTGVPVGANKNVAHLIALHDAGVKHGDSIYVNSNDPTLVATIRSNFGPKVWGKGVDYPMIGEAYMSWKEYDWVYYPKPITYNTAGTNLDSTMAAFRESVVAMKLPVIGKMIFYVSPLAFYHPLGAALVKAYDEQDYKLKDSPNDKGSASSGPGPKIKGYNYVIKDYKHEVHYPKAISCTENRLKMCLKRYNLTAVPEGMPEEKFFYAHIDALETIDKFIDRIIKETRDPLLGEIYMPMFVFKDKQFKSRVTMSSFRGHTLCSPGVEPVAGKQLLGDLYTYVSMCVRNVWWNHVWSPNSYQIAKAYKIAAGDNWKIGMASDGSEYVEAEWINAYDSENQKLFKQQAEGEHDDDDTTSEEGSESESEDDSGEDEMPNIPPPPVERRRRQRAPRAVEEVGERDAPPNYVVAEEFDREE